MGILRREPEGLGAREFDEGEAAFTTSATFAEAGREAASRPPVAARNCLRSRAESLRGFFMRVSSANAEIEQVAVLSGSNALYTSLWGLTSAENRFSSGFLRIARARAYRG